MFKLPLTALLLSHTDRKKPLSCLSHCYRYTLSQYCVQLSVYCLCCYLLHFNMKPKAYIYSIFFLYMGILFYPLLCCIIESNIDPDDLANYRPISNLPFLSKILEKVIANPLPFYLKTISKKTSNLA